VSPSSLQLISQQLTPLAISSVSISFLSAADLPAAYSPLYLFRQYLPPFCS
jgi:hypothetical protein